MLSISMVEGGEMASNVFGDKEWVYVRREAFLAMCSLLKEKGVHKHTVYLKGKQIVRVTVCGTLSFEAHYTKGEDPKYMMHKSVGEYIEDGILQEFVLEGEVER